MLLGSRNKRRLAAERVSSCARAGAEMPAAGSCVYNIFTLPVVLSAIPGARMAETQPDVHELYRDSTQSARRAGLRFISDAKPGITRKATPRGHFSYYAPDGQPIKDNGELERIKRLVIPPAWTDVWISPDPKGHLQVTGRDVKGRKQYRYHHGWSSRRNAHKFDRMRAFAERLPQLRQQVTADMARPQLDRQKVTATVVRLMDTAFVRIGNRTYARQNRSFGLTTLRDRHVEVNGSTIKLHFVGKKGVEQEIDIQDKRLARLVQQCKEIPGYDLFQYYDAGGHRHTIESGDVNAYLREATAHDFTAKDFRTWGGTVLMVKCLSAQMKQEPGISPEKVVREAVKEVAKKLGNTPNVCSKYYIHPEVVSLFRENRLGAIIKKAQKRKKKLPYLTTEEEVVVCLLEELEKASR